MITRCLFETSKSRTWGGNILDNYWKWAENVGTLQREIKVVRL